MNQRERRRRGPGQKGSEEGEGERGSCRMASWGCHERGFGSDYWAITTTITIPKTTAIEQQ